MIEESYLESMGREKGILVPRTLKLGLQLQREIVNSSENGKSIGIRLFYMSPNTREKTSLPSLHRLDKMGKMMERAK